MMFVLLLVLLSALSASGDKGPSLAEWAAAAAREEARAKFEAQRRLALWRYQQATAGGGAQITAAIFAAGYLVWQAGDFACHPNCTVEVSVDDRTPERLLVLRPAA